MLHYRERIVLIPPNPQPLGVMKRLLFLSLLLGAFSWAQLQAQTVHTVDNNAGAVAQFSGVQAAIDAASPGDIILIAGSPTYYGTFDIYKELHFVGVGYFLGTNGVPGLSTHGASVGLNFRNNPSLGNSAGSSATGLSGLKNSDPGANNIVIDKCYDAQNNWRFQGNVTITRCYSRNDIRIDAADSSISNTITWTVNLIAANQSLTNSVIRREIQTTSNQTVRNCIFLEPVTGNSLDLAADYTYCLKVGGGGLPDDGTNINGALLTDVFAAVGASDVDAYYELKEGSLAADAGFGGVDMGAYGGDKPYVLSGIPGRPRMTRFDIAPTATGLTELTFEVESQAFAE